MIPPGYAAPNESMNISINAATAYIARAAKLNVTVGALFISPNPAAGIVSELIPLNIGISNGLGKDDAVNLVDSQGRNIAECAALIAPRTPEALLNYFQVLGNSNPLNDTFNVLVNNLPSTRSELSAFLA